jgi:hypothetical protein
MIIRKSNPIPVEPDGAINTPPVGRVETRSGSHPSAPAALPLGSGRKPHKIDLHNRLIAAETDHDFSDDLPDQPGVIALVGVNGAVEAFQFIDFRSFHGAASSQREQEDNAARY